MDPTELRRQIQRLESIASPSASLDRILSLAADSESDISDLEEAIQLDPAVASRVLRLSNSAYFAVPGGVETIARATLVIGYKNVLTLATCAAMAPVFQSDDANLDRSALWRHSCAVGESARIIGEHARVDGSAAYVAGLLHDLGTAVLSDLMGEKYGIVLDECMKSGDELAKVEHEQLGIDHGWAAAALFESWQVPDRLLAAAAQHHAPSGEPSGFAAIVRLADHMARQAGFEGPGEPAPRRAPPEPWLREIGLGPEALVEIVQQLEDRREVIQLASGGNS